MLPGDRRIERTEKMGVVSNGMLCSGEELGLTADADGILILPADTPLGRPLVELFGDTVLDVDVKPNRGDALSIVGLAREVAAVTGAPLRLPPTDLGRVGPADRRAAARRGRRSATCARASSAAGSSGVHVGPSPDWVQMRLLAAGQRPISNVVDASNYVMLELGKPIHTFDAAAVHDGRIVVRRATAGERFETLDHVVRELDPETLVIADAAGPIGIAGVMGGAASEIGASTTDVVVESAIFDPISIRRTAFRYALRSDASLRFEKGQEWRLARVGADRTARLIAEWAGGEVAPGAVDSNPVEPPTAHVAFRPARVNRLARDGPRRRRAAGAPRPGRDRDARRPPPGRGSASLPARDRSTSTRAMPRSSRRPSRPGAATSPSRPTSPRRSSGSAATSSSRPACRTRRCRPTDTIRSRCADVVRETLAGAGVSEAVTFALVAPRMVERFPAHDDGPLEGEPGQRPGGRPVVVTNPLSLAALGPAPEPDRQPARGRVHEPARRSRRTSPCSRSARATAPPGDPPTHEWWRLGLALTGAAEAAAWDRPARPYDFDDAIGLLELLGRRLGFPALTLTPIADDPNLHPGPGRARGRRRAARRAGSASSIRTSSPSSTCAPSA